MNILKEKKRFQLISGPQKVEPGLTMLQSQILSVWTHSLHYFHYLARRSHLRKTQRGATSQTTLLAAFENNVQARI